MFYCYLAEAMLFEAAFAAFWGDEYPERCIMLTNYEGLAESESYRRSFIRNAAWSRAYEELQRFNRVAA